MIVDEKYGTAAQIIYTGVSLALLGPVKTLVNLAVDQAVGAVTEEAFKGAILAAAKELQAQDSSLTDQEAQILAGTGLIAISAIASYPLAVKLAKIVKGIKAKKLDPQGGGATNGLPVPDDLPTNIHMGGQGKHVLGHNNYDPSRSTLTADPQDLLSGVHSGRYPIIRSIPRGNSTSNIVDFGKPIGDFKADGALVGPTQYGQIVQGKNGAHIIPANPNQY